MFLLLQNLRLLSLSLIRLCHFISNVSIQFYWNFLKQKQVGHSKCSQIEKIYKCSIHSILYIFRFGIYQSNLNGVSISNKLNDYLYSTLGSSVYIFIFFYLFHLSIDFINVNIKYIGFWKIGHINTYCCLLKFKERETKKKKKTNSNTFQFLAVFNYVQITKAFAWL